MVGGEGNIGVGVSVSGGCVSGSEWFGGRGTDCKTC